MIVPGRIEKARDLRRFAGLVGSLDLIAWKVGVYAEHLARGEAAGLWDPSAGASD